MPLYQAFFIMASDAPPLCLPCFLLLELGGQLDHFIQSIEEFKFKLTHQSHTANHPIVSNLNALQLDQLVVKQAICSYIQYESHHPTCPYRMHPRPLDVVPESLAGPQAFSSPLPVLPQTTPATVRLKHPGKEKPSRSSVFWTEKEKMVIQNWVKTHGAGKWKALLEHHRKDFFKAHRTCRHLADQYRRLKAQTVFEQAKPRSTP